MHIRRGTLGAMTVLLLAACDDSNDNTADTTTPAVVTDAPATSAPSTAAATTTTTTTPTVSDAELAQSALLTIDDMPSGWTESPNDDDDEEDAETIQRISDCSGLDAALIGDEVLGDSEAKSPEFQSPDELSSVKHTLGFAPDEATATAAMTAIGDDALAPCYEEAMRTTFEEAAVTTDPADSLPEGMTLAGITMERIDPPVTVGADDAVWYSATATLDFQGQQIEIYLDLLFSRTGRVLSQIEFDGTTTQFPDELYEPTVTAAQAKVDAIAEA
jgi:hypothetical protein